MLDSEKATTYVTINCTDNYDSDMTRRLEQVAVADDVSM